MHDLNYFDECIINGEYGNGTCHYYEIFGGNTIADVTYSGKAVNWYAQATVTSSTATHANQT